MKTVYFRLKSDGQSDRDCGYYKVQRIPQEGEYFILETDGDLYKTEMTIYALNTLNADSERANAEVYAVKIDRDKEIKKKIDDGKTKAYISNKSGW
jgi:hypothetical protein